MTRPAVAIALLCILPAFASAQGTAEPPPAYLVEYSSVAMTRNASLVETGLRLAERGSDWLVDAWTGDVFTKRSVGGVLARFGWWTAFGFIVDGCGAAVAHEYGHATRAEEIGRSGSVNIRCLGTSFFRTTGPRFSATEMMSVFGGGLEAEDVLAERVEERVHAAGTATIGDLSLLFMSRVGGEAYILRSLSEDRLSSPERFLTGGSDGRAGDPSQYALALTAAQLSLPAFGRAEVEQFFAGIRTNARSIRSSSLMNFADYDYLTIGAGIFHDYLWRGERRIRVRWLKAGPVLLSPSLAYRLSPVGPERLVRSRYKVGATSGNGYVRWTDRLAPDSQGLFGIGGDVTRPPLRVIAPCAGFDVWRNPDGTTSARGELGGQLSRSPSDRLVLSFAAGAKGRGYVLGYPMDRGAFVTIGAGLRF